MDQSTIEVVMTIEDSKALTKPWIVTKQFRKWPSERDCMTTAAPKTIAIRSTTRRERHCCWVRTESHSISIETINGLEVNLMNSVYKMVCLLFATA